MNVAIVVAAVALISFLSIICSSFHFTMPMAMPTRNRMNRKPHQKEADKERYCIMSDSNGMIRLIDKIRRVSRMEFY